VKLVRTRQADNDIEAIAEYIGLDSPKAAIRWVEGVEEKFLSLAATPGLGTLRSDVMAGLRTIAFGKYVVCYRQISDGVEILRMIHGARQWEEML
jgi:toxin ParE1/3/4